MGNSPEMYEAWRQNARADHERPQRQPRAHDHPGLRGCTTEHDQVTATLYVGLNHPNRGDWYLQNVGNVVSARHDGFTMFNGVGYWRGKKEHCAIVVISGERSAILATVGALNSVLSQECIGVTWGEAMQFI